MSFAAETEKLVNELIQAEYKNACEKFGDKYNSLHEGYAVLLEEVEEVITETKDLENGCEDLWKQIKSSLPYKKEEMINMMPFINASAKCAIKELAQVGAVLMKIKNTLEVEE